MSCINIFCQVTDGDAEGDTGGEAGRDGGGETEVGRAVEAGGDGEGETGGSQVRLKE